jgi:putative ABC transport system permease protein
MPDWRPEVAARLAGLRLSPAREADVVEELVQHLDERYETLRREGADDADARTAALDELADPQRLEQEMRTLAQASTPTAVPLGGRGHSHLLADLLDDLRYAARTLRRSPGFSAVAMIVLALGIGLNAAVFSVVSALFFRTPPMPASDQLVWIHNPGSAVDLEALQQYGASTLSGFARWQPAPSSRVFSAEGRHERLAGEVVPSSYFSVLGVNPFLGRTLQPDDEVAGALAAVVISYDLWARVFGGRANAIGKEVRLDEFTFTVIGVMPEKFTGLSDPWHPSSYWIPLAHVAGPLTADRLRKDARSSQAAVARLKPGASIQGARSALSALPAAAGATADRYRVRPLADVMIPADPDADVRWIKALAYAGMAIAAAVLLIAAANLTGIVMARGVIRAQELAVRQALGADAFRLARQLFTECLLLSCLGGVAGLFVAAELIQLYRLFSPSTFLLDVSLNRLVLMFTAAVCVSAGLLVGLLPVRQALQVDVLSALGGGPRAGTSRGARRRLRHAIIIPQVALSVVLLIGAAVHTRALLESELSNLGYRIDDVLVLSTGLQPPLQSAGFTWQTDGDDTHLDPNGPKLTDAERIERNHAFDRALLARVRAVPGVSGAAFNSWLPPVSAGAGWTYVRKDAGTAGAQPAHVMSGSLVSEGYFQALGIPLLKGRDFDERDVTTSPLVAVISASVERQLWPNGDAIGQSLAFAGPANGKPPKDLKWLQVIGVVGDVRPVLSNEMTPGVYRPLSQSAGPWQPPMSVVVSGHGDSAALTRQVRRAIDEDPLAQVTRERTMRDVVAEILYPRRAAAWVLGLSGLAGLLLAIVGVYSVVSYSVAQQLRDVGIRSTLGASRAQIIALFVGQGAKTLAFAIVPALPLAFAALRMTSHLVGVAPTPDPAAFAVVPALMAAVVMLACYIPARRAANVDPIAVLRGL